MNFLTMSEASSGSPGGDISESEEITKASESTPPHDNNTPVLEEDSNEEDKERDGSKDSEQNGEQRNSEEEKEEVELDEQVYQPELTEHQQSFLEACEKMFKDRYTDNDAEYMALKNRPLDLPPILHPYYAPPKEVYHRDRRDHHRHHGRRDYRDRDHYRSRSRDRYRNRDRHSRERRPHYNHRERAH